MFRRIMSSLMVTATMAVPTLSFVLATASDEPSVQAKIASINQLSEKLHRQRRQGDLAGALVAAVEQVKLATALRGQLPHGRRTLIAGCYDNLGQVQEEKGDFDGALASYRSALAELESLKDLRPWFVPDARRAVARVEKAQKLTQDERQRYVDARVRLVTAGREQESQIKALSQSGADLKALFGEKSIEYARNQALLAIHQAQVGKHEAAEQGFKESNPLLEEVLTLTHPETAEGMYHHAMLYHRTLRCPEANKLFAKAFAAYSRCYGENHPYAIATLGNWASNLKDEGNFVEGARMTEREVALWRSIPEAQRTDDTWAQMAGAIQNHALCRLELHDLDGAEAAFHESLKILERLFRESRVDSIRIEYPNVLGNVAGFHLTLGDLAGSVRQDAHIAFG